MTQCFDNNLYWMGCMFLVVIILWDSAVSNEGKKLKHTETGTNFLGQCPTNV